MALIVADSPACPTEVPFSHPDWSRRMSTLAFSSYTVSINQQSYGLCLSSNAVGEEIAKFLMSHALLFLSSQPESRRIR